MLQKEARKVTSLSAQERHRFNGKEKQPGLENTRGQANKPVRRGYNCRLLKCWIRNIWCPSQWLRYDAFAIVAVLTRPSLRAAAACTFSFGPSAAPGPDVK